MPPFIDITGFRFGRLTVLGRAENDKNKNPRWDCICDCGNEKVVYGQSLRGGATVSCGCYRLEVVTKHGMTGTPEFIVWQMMLQRCFNPNSTGYEDYGGRGINVCEEWASSFEAFLRDMGERPSSEHTLDRINNDLGYFPENCRWSTPLQQGSNKRNNRIFTVGGSEITFKECCRRFGIKKSTLSNRLNSGMSIEEAISKPVAHKKRPS
jgi:hypothetical protein